MSQWGHDFRPEYRQLTVLHERWPDVPRIALTATADAPTRARDRRAPGAGRRAPVRQSFDRPNIRYTVVDKHDAARQLLRFPRRASRRSGHRLLPVAREGRGDRRSGSPAQGIDALPYHAGLDADTRAAQPARFLREDGIVMVATIAFGMGIDKPDVRFVAHLDLPKCSRATTRKPAAPAATASRPMRGWPTASATWCCCGG